MDAVALGHLAAHVDDLAVPGKLKEDSADAERLERLEGGQNPRRPVGLMRTGTE
jgi:hypothetical protein